MAIRLAIAMGCTPLGAPIIGWVADNFGPRWSLGMGAASGFAAAIVGLHYLRKHRHLRIRFEAGRLHVSVDGEPAAASPRFGQAAAGPELIEEIAANEESNAA
jgi:MFS family permease